MTRSTQPLIIGRDWSHVDLTNNYVAVLELLNPTAHRYVAVRGGRTLGHWSQHEAGIAGRRLQDEVTGRFITAVTVGAWKAWANSACSRRELLTVPEFFVYALSGEEAERALKQYKADPLVVGPVEGV